MMRDAGEKNWRWVGRLMCLSTSMHNLIKKKKNKQILTYGLLMIWKKVSTNKNSDKSISIYNAIVIWVVTSVIFRIFIKSFITQNFLEKKCFESHFSMLMIKVQHWWLDPLIITYMCKHEVVFLLNGAMTQQLQRQVNMTSNKADK